MLSSTFIIPVNMGMKKEVFQSLIQPLLQYNSTKERDYLKPQARLCEHCDKIVDDPCTYWRVYNINIPKKRYYVLRCGVCTREVYNSNEGKIKDKPGPKPKHIPSQPLTLEQREARAESRKTNADPQNWVITKHNTPKP